MKVTVEMHPAKGPARTLELRDGATAEEALRGTGNLPDAWIALREGRPVPMDTPLKEGDRLRFVAVASGG